MTIQTDIAAKLPSLGDNSLNAQKAREAFDLIIAYIDALPGGGATIYESSWTTYVPNTIFTFAHGLGAIPVIVSGDLKCITEDLGYSVGDIIDMKYAYNATHAQYVDATNLYLHSSSASGMARIRNKTTGGAATAGVGDWEFRVRCFV